MPVKRSAATRQALKQPIAQLTRLHWYAVMVRAGTEFAVEALLERRGLVAIVPMRSEWRGVNRYVRRKVAVDMPLLVRYVFVGFDPAQFYRGEPPWHMVMSVTMVQSVVGAGDRPWRLQSGKLVPFLQQHARIVAPAEQQHMRTHHEFGVGDEAVVVDGSLAGLTVRVHSIVGREARVLLPLFGKVDQEIALPLANLEKAD